VSFRFVLVVVVAGQVLVMVPVILVATSPATNGTDIHLLKGFNMPEFYFFRLQNMAVR